MWGKCFDPEQIENTLNQNPDIEWIWAVHSETSTGVLNDLEMLKEICVSTKTRLCLDCVSSIGTVAINLRDVYLATGVSGKGLASYPGLSFVFYNHEILPDAGSVPRYLDLGFYAQSGGIPFTVSSNLLYALGASLKAFDDRLFLELEEMSAWVREQILDLGFEIVAPSDIAAPALITIALPDRVSSKELGQKVQDEGFLLHWRSRYLLERNWIQIALMGECSRDQIKPLFVLLSAIDNPLRSAL